MSELKPRIKENGIDYILVGDYYIPDLKLPEEHRPIGKYGRMHREYLRAERKRPQTGGISSGLLSCISHVKFMNFFRFNRVT